MHFLLENETPLFGTLFLIFAAIFDPDTPKAQKLEERKRLAFIYQMRKLVHPQEEYLSPVQLSGFLLEKPDNISKRAREIATFLHSDLVRT